MAILLLQEVRSNVTFIGVGEVQIIQVTTTTVSPEKEDSEEDDSNVLIIVVAVVAVPIGTFLLAEFFYKFLTPDKILQALCLFPENHFLVQALEKLRDWEGLAGRVMRTITFFPIGLPLGLFFGMAVPFFFTGVFGTILFLVAMILAALIAQIVELLMRTSHDVASEKTPEETNSQEKKEITRGKKVKNARDSDSDSGR